MVQGESQTSLEEMKGERQQAAQMGLCGDSVGKVAAPNQRCNKPKSPQFKELLQL